MLVECTCQTCGKISYRYASQLTDGRGKYCSRTCARWKGGRALRPDGYVMLYFPVGEQFILEHRYLMEQHLGRPLEAGEKVHHINGDKADNRIENLRVMTHGDHMRLHLTGNTFGRITSWSRKHERCIECGTTERAHASRGLCVNCHGRRRKAEARAARAA